MFIIRRYYVIDLVSSEPNVETIILVVSELRIHKTNNTLCIVLYFVYFIVFLIYFFIAYSYYYFAELLKIKISTYFQRCK